MGRSKATAPINNRDCAALLRAWGFEQAEGNGGHVVFVKNGHRVQITAPGRHTPTPYKALRKAAVATGVRLDEFMRGPVKEKTVKIQAIKTDMELPAAAPAAVEAPRKAFGCAECPNSYDTVKGLKVHKRIHVMAMCSKCNQLFDGHGLYPHQKRCDGNVYGRGKTGRILKPRTKARVEEPDDAPLIAPLPKEEPKRAPLVPDSPVAPSKPGRGIDIETDNSEVKDLFELVVPAGRTFSAGGLRVLAQWIEATEELYEVLNG